MKPLLVILLAATLYAKAAAPKLETLANTNSIAFSESRGDRSANLVLSTLELAMMDPVERGNLIASLQAQYGSPRVWASRSSRAPSDSALAFARSAESEKYGIRLRARQALPTLSPHLAEAAPTGSGNEPEPGRLLGVHRSELLTWRVSQDWYLEQLRDKSGNCTFKYVDSNTWINPGFNYKLPFSDLFYAPLWNGAYVKLKLDADVSGRFEYKQLFYHAMRDGLRVGAVRNVQSGATLGARMKLTGAFGWGHDWHIPFGLGHWGLGAEVSISLQAWPNVSASINSMHTSDLADYLSINLSLSPQVEDQGTVWIGVVEDTNEDGDDSDPFYKEQHKLVGGISGQVVFVGTLSFGAGYKCKDWDWANDIYSEKMEHIGRLGNSMAKGTLSVRGEIKLGPWTLQNGWRIWDRQVSNDGWHERTSIRNNNTMDDLL